MMLPMTVRCNVCGTFMYKASRGWNVSCNGMHWGWVRGVWDQLWKELGAISWGHK